MPSKLEEIVARERQYLLPTYNRYPLAIERGKGIFVWDYEGRRYLDLLGGLGVNALGHAHPRIVKIIRKQAARLIHISNLYYNEYQGQLAEKLCRLSGMARAFFSNSGTEAMEGALKLARAAAVKTPGKCGIVALEYLQIIEDENLLENVRRVGAFLQSELQALTSRWDFVVEARGTGFIQALEINMPGRPVVEAMMQEGVLLNSTQDKVLRFLPPFLVQEKHVERALKILRKILKAQSR